MPQFGLKLSATMSHAPGLEFADYAWRVETTRTEWQAAMQVLVGEITYPNFKSAVHDDSHHDAYMDVWSVMYKLNDTVGPVGAGGAED